MLVYKELSQSSEDSPAEFTGIDQYHSTSVHLLPAQEEGTTGVETPAFPSTDNLSWPDSHHFPLPYQNIESKALTIVSGFQVPGLWSILQELWVQEMVHFGRSGNQAAGKAFLAHTPEAAQEPLHSRRAAPEMKAIMMSAISLLLSPKYEQWAPQQPQNQPQRQRNGTQVLFRKCFGFGEAISYYL